MTASNARPPSDTGWHEHVLSGVVHEDRLGICTQDAPTRPVIVVGPAKARETLAQHRQEHNPATGASACSCGGWVGPFTMLPGSDERSFAAHLVAALAGQDPAPQASDHPQPLTEVLDDWDEGHNLSPGEAVGRWVNSLIGTQHRVREARYVGTGMEGRSYCGLTLTVPAYRSYLSVEPPPRACVSCSRNVES